MSKSVEKGDLLDYLLCPLCSEVPKAEVYQCRDGHVVCQNCCFKCAHCPQCHDPFDYVRPIRCRPFEEILARLKLKCPFKSNGCKVVISKENLKTHIPECYYDFEKFGQLVNLCKEIGYTKCGGGVNNGNTDRVVNHFVWRHKCTLTKSEVFKMDLKWFDVSLGSNGCFFWTPVIADLKDQKCFLMTLAIRSNEDKGFTLLPVFLPYLQNQDKETCPVQMKYTIQTKDSLGRESFTMKRNPVSIGEAYKMLTNEMQFICNSKTLLSNCSIYGTLSVQCKIKPVGDFSTGKKAEFECAPHFKMIKVQSTISKTGFNKPFIFDNFNAMDNNHDMKNVPVSGEALKPTATNTSQGKSKTIDISTTGSVFGSKEAASPVKPLSLVKDSDGGSDNTSTSDSSKVSGAPDILNF